MTTQNKEITEGKSSEKKIRAEPSQLFAEAWGDLGKAFDKLGKGSGALVTQAQENSARGYQETQKAMAQTASDVTRSSDSAGRFANMLFEENLGGAVRNVQQEVHNYLKDRPATQARLCRIGRESKTATPKLKNKTL